MADKNGHMDRTEFVEDELIQALINALDFDASEDRPANTWRVEEIKDALAAQGLTWSPDRIRKHIRRLIQDGRARVVNIQLMTIAGKRTVVAAYQIDGGAGAIEA